MSTHTVTELRNGHTVTVTCHPITALSGRWLLEWRVEERDDSGAFVGWRGFYDSRGAAEQHVLRIVNQEG